MIKKSFSSILFLSLALGVFMASCKDDDQPKATKITGTITIENTDVWAVWQDSGEVQLTIFPAFSLDPLAGWGVVPDNTFGPGVPGGTFAVGAPYNAQNPIILTYTPGKTTYDYELEVEPGTYSALALGFRHDFVNDPSLKTATLGVHWDNEATVSHGVVIKIPIMGTLVPIFNFPAPSTIEIEEGEQLELNFKADFDFVNQWYQ